MGDEEPQQNFKKAILSKLWRRGVFGGRYIPIEKALSKIPRHDWDKAKDVIEEMHREGLVQLHKNKDCISINPPNKDEVKKLLEGHLPDFVLERR